MVTSIAVVVVLPWVPDTAIGRLVRTMAPCRAGRPSTGIPRSSAARRSTLSAGTAVEQAT
jgi:hypothetical protein